MVAALDSAAQRRRRSRSLSSGSFPLLHAHRHRGVRSLICRGWRAKLVDAPCSQAALYAHERLHTARCYPCASTVRVGPAVDAVPCAGKWSNMVPVDTTHRSWYSSTSGPTSCVGPTACAGYRSPYCLLVTPRGCDADCSFASQC